MSDDDNNNIINLSMRAEERNKIAAEREARKKAIMPRKTIRLSPNVLELLEEIMTLSNSGSIEEALRLAISDELFLLRKRKEGYTVLIQKGDEYREVTWADNSPTPPSQQR